MVLAIILAIILAIAGAVAFEFAGFFFGGLLGFLLGYVMSLASRVKLLEQQLTTVRELPARVSAPVEPVVPEHIPEPVAAPEPLQPEYQPEPEPVRVSQRMSQSTYERLETSPEAKPVRYQEDVFDKLAARIKSFFTDGNVFVKIGIVITFVGVGFLLKLAADRGVFTLEMRFIFAALLGIGLLYTGWRLRHSKTVFGLLLQGGGVGVLYLTVFAAARLFDLLPLGLALAVMIAIVVFSAILAVLQNARYLAMFGAAGGFLAPILTSTGGGNHVMLFSYYALLNLGIVYIAWYRSWRGLNLLGFLFTFIIGLSWGLKYYRPEFFNSVEPFLILFFIFFVVIAVLFAIRQPPQLKGYVDSTLVFGVPVMAFALQTALVKDIEYGLAISALCVSALYIGLALTLWRRAAEGLRLLTEAFLALGVVFGTLAIPLALDGRWTSAAWALEGAAIIWVGVRQQRLLARLFGIVLQLGAGVAFFTALLHFDHRLHFIVTDVAQQMLVFNSTYLGAVLISMAGLFSSYYIYKYRDSLHEFEQAAHIFLLVWGLTWWLGAGYREIHHYLDLINHFMYFPALLLLFVTGSAVLLQRIERRLKWAPAHYPVLGLIVAMYLVLLMSLAVHVQHPFWQWGALAWPLAFVCQYFFLYQYRKEVRQGALKWQHVTTLWLLIGLLTWDSAWWVRELTSGFTWKVVTWGVLPAALLLVMFRLRSRLRWPLQVHNAWYVVIAGLPVMILLWIYSLRLALGNAGDPWPLEMYVPVLNPLELSVIFIILTMAWWGMELRRVGAESNISVIRQLVAPATAITGFALINGMVARTIHHWLDVPYRFYALNHSVEFHASLSVIWTITALTITIIATRTAQRSLWFVGAGLLVLVVIKLFMVDLASSGTLARTVSFLTVGVLFLLTGYFSPLPPKNKENKS